MKKMFLILLPFLFVSCVTSENLEGTNTKNLVLYCTKAKEAYYLEDENEIKQVLSLFPKTKNIGYDIKQGLKTIALMNENPYADYTLYIKHDEKVTKVIHIDLDNEVWYTDKTQCLFPKENIDKIISKMNKGIKHTKTIKNAKERRQFIENLRKDDNAIYINLHSWADFDLQMGSFYIYVPGSKEQKIDSEAVLNNLRKHYGDTKNTLTKDIHNYSISRPKRYIEETHEYEFEMRWTKEMYDKIDIYRKSEFKDDNYEAQQTFEYYTKD